MITPREGCGTATGRGRVATKVLRRSEYKRGGHRWLAYSVWPSQFGWPAQVSGEVFLDQEPLVFLYGVCARPPACHQICMYLGSNPLDIADFDAKIEIFMGQRARGTCNRYLCCYPTVYTHEPEMRLTR